MGKNLNFYNIKGEKMKKKWTWLLAILTLASLMLWSACSNNSSVESGSEQTSEAIGDEPLSQDLVYEEKADGVYVKVNPNVKDSITAVEIPVTYNGKTVVGIADLGFEYCSQLREVSLPTNLKKIGERAFFNCPLQTLVLPDTIQEIKDEAFSWCNQLQSVTLSDGLVTLGDGAFRYCSSLQKIVLPDSLISVGERAFAYCQNLKEITIGESLEEIGADAFLETPSIQKVIYTGELSSWCIIQFGSKLSNPISVSGNLFDAEGEITELILDENTTDILKFAFAGWTALQRVVLPKSILSIEYNAFDGCSGVKEVVYQGTADEWTSVSFVEGGNTVIKNKLTFN